MAGHVISVFMDEPFASASLLDLGRLEAIARRVLEEEGAAPCELSIAVIDDDSVRRMNRDYAGVDAVTDVLSFSQREGEEFTTPPGSLPPLGEVIIAYPQALRQAQAGLRRQANERGASPEKEVERLLVHGTLHLLGYDHAESGEARRMRDREDELLDSIGASGSL